MANPAFGFRLTNASTAPQPLVTCIHLAGDSVLLGKGDAVKKVTGSTSIGNNGQIVQAVARAASGDKVYGIVVSCEQHTVAAGSINLNRTYCPASTAMYINVHPVSADEVFSVVEDGVGGSVATTNVGKNASMIVADANTVSGESQTMLDSSTVATTNTLDLAIVGFDKKTDNTPGNNAVILVKFNNVENVNQRTGV